MTRAYAWKRQKYLRGGHDARLQPSPLRKACRCVWLPCRGTCSEEPETEGFQSSGTGRCVAACALHCHARHHTLLPYHSASSSAPPSPPCRRACLVPPPWRALPPLLCWYPPPLRVSAVACTPRASRMSMRPVSGVPARIAARVSSFQTTSTTQRPPSESCAAAQDHARLLASCSALALD